MNQKAQLFLDRMAQLQITAFQGEEMADELHTVVFYSHLEVNGQLLRFQVILDDSMYVIVRIYVAEGLITSSRRYHIFKILNGFNKNYKLFKFYVDDARNLVFDCTMTFIDDAFDPQMVQQAIEVAQNYLNQEYAGMMKAIKNK